jgi:hypothetical protein
MIGFSAPTGYALDYVRDQLNLRDQIFEQLDIVNRKATTDEQFIAVVPSPKWLREDEANEIYLHHIVTDSLQRIHRVWIVGRVVIEVSKVPLTHGQIQTTAIAWGHGNVAGKDVLVAAIEDDDGKGQAWLRFGEATEYDSAESETNGSPDAD